MSEADGRVLPALDTFPGLVLALTALSGELPAALVSRLPASDTYKEYAVKRLKRDNLLRTFYRNGVRGLRLTAAAKRLLVECWPDQFLPYLSGSTETNQLKSEITRRLRLHRMAEVLVSMYNAGVLMFPWETPPVFGSALPPVGTSISQPSYYSSREVKEIGPQTVKIRGSRAAGVLLADSGVFSIYNTGATQMKWAYKSEMRLKALLQMELCQNRFPDQFMNAQQCAIVFGTDMERLDTLMGADGGKPHNYFALDGSFDHFCFLTSDHKGEAILRLLCDPDLRETLDGILTENLRPPNPDYPVENDGFEDMKPVLFGYACDMPRIRRFDTALALRGERGLMICFDFQEDALRRCCGPQIQFQCLDFEACERSVFLSTKSR